MTPTQTVKQYGETAVKLYKTQLLATIGAGDLAVERARTAVASFRSRAEALPGEPLYGHVPDAGLPKGFRTASDQRSAA